MNFILKNIRKVLSENRIDDVKKKFPEVDPEIIDYFVRHDPSNNNKYLDWMVKAITHKPTLQTIGEILNDNDLAWGEPAAFIVNLVRKFHELLPYMKNVSTNDLYQYRFTDSEMIHYLGNDLLKAKERKEEKEEQKDAKKNSDKIYEDKDWLVVRPKTWEASCVYGAGTKWCTTSKVTDSHFKRETERNFLIYVINKNKISSDNEYKVAWQIPYTKDVKTKYVKMYADNPTWTIDVSKIKLWNAEDTNIANNSYMGVDYMDTIPRKVKSNILNYMSEKMEDFFSNTIVSDDPRIQALIIHLGLNEDEALSVEELDYDHYGLALYNIGELDRQYAVGTNTEIDSAKEEYVENMVESEGAEYFLKNMRNKEKYIYIPDAGYIASDDAENYVSDLRDDDVLYYAERSHDTNISETLSEYNVNMAIHETNEEEIDEIKGSSNELTDEQEAEIEELEKENEGIEVHNDKLLQRLRSLIHDEYYENVLHRMKNDPISWLEDFGYIDRNGNLEKYALNIVSIDERQLKEDLVDAMTIGELGHYDGDYNTVDVENETYYIIRTE